MYYPYLRAKGEEINSLLQLPLKSKVLPILEPVSIKNANVNKFKQLVKNKIPFIIIINPQVGNISIEEVLEIYVNGVLHDYDNYSIAYIVHNATTQIELQSFNQIPNRDKFLIHKTNFENVNLLENLNIDFHVFCKDQVSSNYINSITSSNKIILLDGFKKLQRNADYPLESFFSDMHFTYEANGFIGIGDYLTQGDNYSLSGGPAYAVAIHLTVLKNNEVYVRHFISNNREGNSRVAEKFYEALTHLINYVDNNTVLETTAIQKYRELYDSRHFPGLSVNKRLSLINHIEQIASII
ncbi:sce7725 family protein [Myroides sp. BIT-d1]|uniref:Sce7725 family protein n=1 Tax=Myroides albus TaxID=2562892 RepID=A0A6I3LIB7_9FLAO|nr:sce7725 family protein [Myroides albus]MTG99349.1 sce7725 family protein [Myroides albus]